MMNNVRRFFIYPGAILLIGCLICGLFGCGGNGKDLPGTSEETPDPTLSEKMTSGDAGAEAPMWTLAQDGEFLCRILYPRQGASWEQEVAEELGAGMKSLCNASLEVLSDVVPYSEDALEIYIGNTRYPESAAAMEQIGYGDYTIKRSGNKIVITATQRALLKNAVRNFLTAMRSVSSDGTVRIPADCVVTVTETPLLNEIPKLNTTSLKSYTISGNMSYTIVSENAPQSLYDDYLSRLENMGYTHFADSKIADNLFATYQNGKAVVNVSYIPLKKALHVTVDSLDYTALPISSLSETRLCTTQMSLLGCSANANSDNGLSIFFRLADGRFLIWDGGGNDPAKDASNLYEKLRESADAAGIEKIVVAGWFITHCHDDHALTFQQFCRNYTDRVEVESLILCPNTAEYGVAVSDGLSIELNTMTLTRSRFPDAKIVIARAGQRFSFADVTVDVLFTLDMLMPYSFTDYNMSSVVCMVTAGEKKILITGDSATDSMNFMADIYGETLHCDYLQVPHHGAIPGGTIQAYRKIQPAYLLWTAGPLTYHSVISDSYNGSYINQYLLETMGLKDRLYLAGSLGEVTTISF